MLLPDCKYCSGFFAVICLLPFSLLLLPPLFPSCPAAVSVLPRRCFWRCSFCCFGWSCIVPVLLPLLFLPLFFLLPRLLLRCSRGSSRRFLSLPSPNFPCRPMRPVPPRTASGQPPVPGTQPALGVIRKAAAKLRCSGLVAVTCLLCRIRPGNLTGAGPENLAGCLSGVFCMGARDPRVVRLPGRAGLDVYRIRFRT